MNSNGRKNNELDIASLFKGPSRHEPDSLWPYPNYHTMTTAMANPTLGQYRLEHPDVLVLLK